MKSNPGQNCPLPCSLLAFQVLPRYLLPQVFEIQELTQHREDALIFSVNKGAQFRQKRNFVGVVENVVRRYDG